MSHIIELCKDLKPKLVEYNNYRPITSIINLLIKQSEKNFPSNRQYVKQMLPFDGSNDICVKGAGDFGFFNAIYESYNNHWALKTIPDDWWYTIIRVIAVAIHEKSKHKSVKKFFVSHDGKKCLNVNVDKMLRVNHECIYRDMTNLIQSSINVTGYVDTIVSDFSTSTSTHRIVSEITVMASTQHFFEYCLRTECGIPYVELVGEVEDWIKLRTKFTNLRKLLQPIDEVIMPIGWWD